MNKIIITGNITKDIEIKTTVSGKRVATFSVAVNRFQKDAEGNNITDFFTCTAWENRAETIAKYCGKGSKILIEGEMQSRKYQKNDETLTAWEIRVDGFEFIGTKKDEAVKVVRNSRLEPIDNELPF